MKTTLFIFALMLSAAMAFAQEKDATPSSFPQFGVRVGYSTSIVHGNTFEGKCLSGTNAGIIADFRVTDSWNIRPGVYFTMKGFDEKSASDIDYKARLNYLEVPLLAVYKKAIGSKCALELQVGPYFSYGISGKSDQTKMTYDRYSYYKTFDMFKRFDWGANVGIGFDIDKFYIGAAYDFGFVSIIRHALNHCIMANVGYRIL